MAGQRFNSGQVADWGVNRLQDNRFLDNAAERIPFGTWLGQTTQTFFGDGRPTGFWAWLDYPWSLTSLNIVVSTAATDAGQLFRLGIYQELQPRRVSADVDLSLVADAGTVAVSSQGLKTATLGSAVTLRAGVWYWVMAQPEASKTNQPTLGACNFASAGVHGVSIGPLSNNWRGSNGVLTQAVNCNAQVAGGLEATKAFGRANSGADQAAISTKGFIAFGGTWA